MRHPVSRTALSVAALALTAAGLSACGGDDTEDTSADASVSASPSESASASQESEGEATSGEDSPTDTSVEEFCDGYQTYFEEFTSAGAAGGDDIVATIKKYAGQLAETGTPSDIPDEARSGFELSVDAAEELPDDATMADLNAAAQKYSADQQKDAQAFVTYVQSTCPDLLSSLTENLPSDIPTELPSGVPTTLPSNIPTSLPS